MPRTGTGYRGRRLDLGLVVSSQQRHSNAQTYPSLLLLVVGQGHRYLRSARGQLPIQKASLNRAPLVQPVTVPEPALETHCSYFVLVF